ncbi:hypothetical protein FNF31_02432 [Cafeteria roenbergensis]|uniref:Uncharacterized protein n=1 Tax=Cafeteria roenbergensis TaxID=33653 RepID=A0A5A8DFK4_CAFRO|nr:hypothetical protein FNF31_02432 [Cafeteria roenbergensis]
MDAVFRLAKRFRGALQDDEVYLHTCGYLLGVASDAKEARLSSADPEFRATVGKHPTGLALLQAMMFDVITDTPKPSPGDGSSAAAPAETPAEPAATGEASAAGGAAPEAAPSEKGAAVYGFVGTDEDAGRLPAVIAALYEVLDQPMPPAPSTEDAAPATADGDDDGLDEAARAVLAQCVPYKFFEVDLTSGDASLATDESLAKLVDHGGTLMTLIKSLLEANSLGEAIDFLKTRTDAASAHTTGPNAARERALHQLPERARGPVLSAMVTSVVAYALACRWSLALKSRALTADQLCQGILRRVGRRLHMQQGEGAGARLLAMLRAWPLLRNPAPYAKLEGVPELDEAEVRRAEQEEAIQSLQVADSDVDVAVVAKEPCSAAQLEAVSQAVLLASHRTDVARRLAALGE